MINTKLFTLDAAYIRRAFQLSVELDVKNSIHGTVIYNGTLIYNWAKEKFLGLQMPESVRTFTKNRAGQEVNVIFNPEKPYFCIKASHPDTTVPARFWTTEAEILVIESKVLLGVKLSYSIPLSQDDKKVDYSVPAFVNKIYRNNRVRDIRILGSVWNINETNIDELYQFVQDNNRKIPVVMITESANVEGIDGQYLSNYLVNAERLAKKVGLIAHVVYLSDIASQLWSEKVGKNWGVYNGAVRTYFPGITFDEDTYMQHPLSVANRILATNYEDEKGNEYIAGEAFEYVLMNNLRRYNTNVRLDWEGIGHKFYFIANREELRNKEKTVKDAALLNKMYEDQIQELDNKIKIQEDEILTAMIETENVKEELADCRQTIYWLNSRVESLTQQLKELCGGEQGDIPILNDYSQLESWVQTYFSGKLILHKRAINALKKAISSKAVYEDPELVFKALKLLGTTYYQMRMGDDISLQEFKQKCSELGIEEAPSITESKAGELGDTYYVEYHGKKCKLERHLKKGKVRDPKYCMRIYFFWSEEESQVVIGSLPQHLTISTS